MSWSVSVCGSGLEERAKFIEDLGGNVVMGKIGVQGVHYDEFEMFAASCELFGVQIIMWEEFDRIEPYMEYNEQDGKYYPAGDGETYIFKLKMEIRGAEKANSAQKALRGIQGLYEYIEPDEPEGGPSAADICDELYGLMNRLGMRVE